MASGLAAAQPCAWPSFALPVDLGIPVEERWPELRTAEVDGDGRPDLLALFSSGRVVVFWNRAGGLEGGVGDGPLTVGLEGGLGQGGPHHGHREGRGGVGAAMCQATRCRRRKAR